MAFVALFVAAKFALYLGFFFLLARILDVGTPVDALRAAAHRTWLGAAATLVTLMSYMVLRLLGTAEESNLTVGAGLTWLLRAGLWIWVTTWVYRVTRWRKGKLAVLVLLGLALDFGVDFGLARLPGDSRLPSFGGWTFWVC